MKGISKPAQGLFKKWGSEGGRSRKKALSPSRRSRIASQAAHARWGKKPVLQKMESIRLEKPSLEDPVYLEEILSEGGLREWRMLYHQVADHPFGETAKALEKVVCSVEIYGTTNLWRSLLKNLRGGTNG